MTRNMHSRRGGRATTATRFEDTLINAGEAAALLRCPISRVRERAQAGELPVEGWQGTQPYFRAGDIMATAGMPSTTPRPRQRSAAPAVRNPGWYWVTPRSGDEPACALWEGDQFWLHGRAVDAEDIAEIGPRALPPNPS